MKKPAQKGSLTIFSVLSLVVIAATLFSLLEAARLLEINRSAEQQSQLAMESVFASYNTFLWENYHLLATDQQEMERILIKVGNARYSRREDGVNLLLYEVDEVHIEGYTLLTDGRGAAYIEAVSSYMEENILYETAKVVYNQYEAIKSLTDSGELDVLKIDDALSQLEVLQQEIYEKEESRQGEEETAVTTETEKNVTNPFELVKRLQETGILELVMEDTSTLSQAEIDVTNVVSTRELAQGINSVYEEVTWFDTVLLQQYLLVYMSNYSDQKENRTLSYELEYIIGKKESDIENLKAAVTQLLAIREAANMLYLMTDVTKIEEANAMAVALVGASANPILIETVKTGLLTTWAFVESVLDVRALLMDKKIPLLKSETLWTSDLNNLEEITQGYAIAKESSVGLSYETYLGILLLFQEEESLALHAMDMQEAALRVNYNDSQLCMDHLMINAQAGITYEYQPIFPFLRVIDAEQRWDYRASTIVNYGYE